MKLITHKKICMIVKYEQESFCSWGPTLVLASGAGGHVALSKCTAWLSESGASYIKLFDVSESDERGMLFARRSIDIGGAKLFYVRQKFRSLWLSLFSTFRQGSQKYRKF